MTLSKAERLAKQLAGRPDEQPWIPKIKDVFLVYAPDQLGPKLVGIYEKDWTYDDGKKRNPSALARAHAKRVGGTVKESTLLKQAYLLGEARWFVLGELVVLIPEVE